MNIDLAAEHALAGLTAQVRREFSADPVVAMSSLGLTVRTVPGLASRRDDGGACDGISFLEDDIVLYAPTPTSRRENFTLAHEFGHWLVERNEEILNLVADRDDPGKVVETVCDRVAQRLLLPDTSLAALRGRAVRASDLIALYETTQASRPVCAIAMAQLLPRLGIVAIIDLERREIATSSVHPDPDYGWPAVFPWPGQPVPAGHPFAAMVPGDALTRKSYWRTPWNAEQAYYIDALHDGRRVIAVFSDVDLWQCEPLHLDAPVKFDERPVSEIHCCGQTRTARGYPCGRCGQHHCPACKRCRCERLEQKEVLCRGGCYLRYMSHLLADGLCSQCRV